MFEDDDERRGRFGCGSAPLGDQRLFFGFSIFPVCLSTKDFTRAHSFLTPLAKSRGPYSNSTTKLKVKTMNRTNQKNPRRSAIQQGSRFKPAINGTATGIVNSRLGGTACAVPTVPPTATTVTAFTPAAGNACSPDSSWWQVGTRTQWNPHPDLDIGVDVLWSHLNTAFKGPSVAVPASGARPACASLTGGCAIDDQDVLSVMFRIQRNFLP